jgi:hypothetical protein
VLTAQLRARVLAATRRKPKDGSLPQLCATEAEDVGLRRSRDNSRTRRETGDRTGSLLNRADPTPYSEVNFLSRPRVSPAERLRLWPCPLLE